MTYENGPTGWVVTVDYLAEPETPACVGIGQTLGEQERSDAESLVHRVLWVSEGHTAAEVHDPVPFRVLDDDGEVYYKGAIRRDWLEGPENLAFAPLAWAEADAGAVTLQYKNTNNEWETL